jgi:ABC-type transport system involved in multi-copper enzyme maturation permease subunit
MHRFHPQANPIIVRELRTRMRGSRPYLILSIFLVLLALTGVGVYYLMLQQSRLGMVVLSPQIGQALFKGLAFVELLLIVVLAPALTSGAISGEREQLTYDMLLATPLHPGQVLWGKLIAALSYLLLLIVAAIPVFSVVLVFGGVDPAALVKAVALLLATTITFGAIGLCASTLFRRTAWATALSYGVVLLMIGVSLTLASVWGQVSSPPGQQPPPWLLYLNPFSALFAITSLAPPVDPAISFLGYTDPLSMLPFVGMLAQGVVAYGPNGAVVIPIYRATLLAYALLTVLLGWISAHTALPYQRWRPRWSDLVFFLLALGLIVVGYLTRTWWFVPVPDQMGIWPAMG